MLGVDSGNRSNWASTSIGASGDIDTLGLESITQDKSDGPPNSRLHSSNRVWPLGQEQVLALALHASVAALSTVTAPQRIPYTSNGQRCRLPPLRSLQPLLHLNRMHVQEQDDLHAL